MKYGVAQENSIDMLCVTKTDGVSLLLNTSLQSAGQRNLQQC